MAKRYPLRIVKKTERTIRLGKNIFKDHRLKEWLSVHLKADFYNVSREQIPAKIGEWVHTAETIAQEVERQEIILKKKGLNKDQKELARRTRADKVMELLGARIKVQYLLLRSVRNRDDQIYRFRKLREAIDLYERTDKKYRHLLNLPPLEN